MDDGRNQLKEGEFWYWHDEKTGDGEPDFRSSAHDSEKLIACRNLNFFIGKNNSGKSQFLRRLFVGDPPKDFNSTLPEDLSKQIFETVSKSIRGLELYQDAGFQAVDLHLQVFKFQSIQEVLRHLKKTLDESADSRKGRNPFKNRLENLRQIADSYKLPVVGMRQRTVISLSKYFETIIGNLTESEHALDQNLDVESSFYIPTLRGLRPTQPNDSTSKTPYVDRSIKDYFDSEKQSTENVITGENLYIELTQALLGEPEQRENIREYEQALSQYFFDGATISLIPKYGEDTINIKIGDDKQFSVTQLGDGLQQVLILTYEAFLKRDQRCAFFIEEPELHMHAGMLRQLMNFYLNETKHFYFFTTHSNHLVDMVDESSDVMIQKFQKRQDPETKQSYFQIDQCDRDRDLLAQLGVRPSSVYLSNCTIWVEGITDRLYIHRYMQRYLQDLKDEKPALYAAYQRFMPNYHYSFVEYQGGNLTHWNFDQETAQGCDKNGGLNADWVCSNALLIADGDIKGKRDRVDVLKKQLGDRFYLLECKEIENTLPTNLIVSTAIARFNRMNGATKQGIDISPLESITEHDFFFHSKDGIGRLLDRKLGKIKANALFQDDSGTIKKKLEFCQDIIKQMDKPDCEWQLTDSAKALCTRVFQHIADQNP